MEVILGAHLSRARTDLDPVGVAALSVALILASAQCYNDLHDERADMAVDKNRPMARGFVSREFAWVTAVLTYVAGVSLLLAACGLAAGLVAGALGILSILYSLLFKQVIIGGNMMAALLSAAPIPFGGYIGDGVEPDCVIAFLFTVIFLVAYEIVKTWRDEHEDRLAGLRTIATECDARALRITLWCVACPVILGPAASPFLAPTANLLVALLLAVGLSVPMIIGLSLLTASAQPSPGSFTWAVKWLQLCWLPAMAALWWVSQPAGWP